MKFALALLTITFPLISLSQEKIDVGLHGGAMYHMGDFNPAAPFYNPSPTGGFLLRFNPSNFYSLRASFGVGSIRGNYNPALFYLPANPRSFAAQVVHGEVVAEIGFLPFDTQKPKLKNISPYVVAGAGVAYIGGAINPTIPFGVGVKYALGKRLSVSAEWRLHKTFNDTLDGYSNRPSFMHNNDWLAVGGVQLMYRLQNKGAICPVYR